MAEGGASLSWEPWWGGVLHSHCLQQLRLGPASESAKAALVLPGAESLTAAHIVMCEFIAHSCAGAT